MELIKITEKNGQKVVNARDLHAFLGSKQEFSNWIKDRINQYGFVENEDFEVFDNFIKNPNGGRPSKDYAISLDMAKELSMVERNDKGREARRYFITMEKIARNNQMPKLTAKQQLRFKRYALINTIKENLLHGDVTAVARANGFKIHVVKDVMKGRSFRPDVIKAIYNKAMERKESLGLDIDQMIGALNQ